MVEKEETDEGNRTEPSEDEEEEEKQANSAKRKRHLRSRSVCDEEEEQAGPSSQLTPGQRKRSKKICFCKSPPANAPVNMTVYYLKV